MHGGIWEMPLFLFVVQNHRLTTVQTKKLRKIPLSWRLHAFLCNKNYSLMFTKLKYNPPMNNCVNVTSRMVSQRCCGENARPRPCTHNERLLRNLGNHRQYLL